MLDVHAFAGKAQADVAKVLGAPSRKEKSKYGPKLSYRDGKVEVVFIDGKADWITVSGMSGVPFDSNSIERMRRAFPHQSFFLVAGQAPLPWSWM